MTKWNEIEQILLGSGPLDPYTKDNVARDLASEMGGMVIYPQSLSRIGGRGAVLAALDGGLRRVVWVGATGAEAPRLRHFPVTEFRRNPVSVRVLDADDETMDLLRAEIPWLRPRPNPGGPSIGVGDVFGMATPGHIRGLSGSRLFPLLAQRSVRQNERTGRGFASAIRDVVWGVFREGFEQGFGADADHLSKPEEVEEAAQAGFVRFTLSLAEGLPDVGGLGRKELARRFAQLESRYSWVALWRKKYLGKSFQVPVGIRKEGISFDEQSFLVSALRLADMLAGLTELSQVVSHAKRGQPFEIEISLDEAQEPTTPHEHLMLALELADLGVPVSAIAPRFPEDLIEGLPYEGNPSKVARRIELHAGIARLTSQHAVSVHSAGGKWTLISRLGEATSGLFHAKVSAPAHHEALRLVLLEEPELFSDVVELAKVRYEPQGYRGWSLEPSLLPSCAMLTMETCQELFFESREGLLLLRSSLGPLMSDKGVRRRLHELLGRREEKYLELVAGAVQRHARCLEEGHADRG